MTRFFGLKAIRSLSGPFGRTVGHNHRDRCIAFVGPRSSVQRARGVAFGGAGRARLHHYSGIRFHCQS